MGLKNMISQLGDEQSLNIAGPRESEQPGAYDRCLAIFIDPYSPDDAFICSAFAAIQL
jgi:hypothetical protein